MSSLTKLDLWVWDKIVQISRKVKARVVGKPGRHRTNGISTMEWVRMNRMARDC